MVCLPNTRRKKILEQYEIDKLCEEAKNDNFFTEHNEDNKSNYTLMDKYNRNIELALTSVIDIIDFQREQYKDLNNKDKLEIDMTIKMYNKLAVGLKEKIIQELPEFIKNEIHTIDHNLELFRSHGEYSQAAYNLQDVLFRAYYALHDAIEDYIEYELEGENI